MLDASVSNSKELLFTLPTSLYIGSNEEIFMKIPILRFIIGITEGVSSQI